MRTRQEIKAFGKEAFKANYWNCVVVCLLIGLVMGIISGIASIPMVRENAAALAENPQYVEMQPSSLSNIVTILEIFIVGPLSVGVSYFFIKNLYVEERVSLSTTTPFEEAFKGYGRKLGGTLLIGIYTCLWSLLFIIPGIIKAYSYSMAPNILADCPNVKANDAITLSRKMMNGHKWEYFVFQLSFIGWAILSVFTLGLLNIFFLSPYMASASALYYVEVRAQALANGVITEGQLAGNEPVLK